MKQGGAESEDQQRAATGDRPPSGRTLVRRRHRGAARALMIDRRGRNRENGNDRQSGEDRSQKKNGALPETAPDQTGSQGDENIAGMIESRVPSHAGSQQLFGDQSQRQRRHRRTE